MHKHKERDLPDRLCLQRALELGFKLDDYKRNGDFYYIDVLGMDLVYKYNRAYDELVIVGRRLRKRR